MKEPPPSQPGIFRGDEFHVLVHDFNHMAERLESLVNAQRLLLRDVSHELRSPLARLSVALELAREDADSTMTTHLDRIQREAERLNQLIGQLLTLSSMEAARGQQVGPVSLRGLLEEMLPDAEYEAQQRDAAVQLDAECDCVIEGRRELIYRAIENVVRNAVRYTVAGFAVACGCITPARARRKRRWLKSATAGRAFRSRSANQSFGRSIAWTRRAALHRRVRGGPGDCGESRRAAQGTVARACAGGRRTTIQMVFLAMRQPRRPPQRLPWQVETPSGGASKWFRNETASEFMPVI